MAISQLAPAFAITNPHDFYVPGNPYTASELSAMAYQGLLRPQFGSSYVAADIPDTASQRAKSVRLTADRLIEGSWTATLLTAAWIYLGGQAPEVFEAATAQQHRGLSRATIIPTTLRHCDYLERVDIRDEDLRVIGGIVVTSPELTIKELEQIAGSQRHQHQAAHLSSAVRSRRL